MELTNIQIITDKCFVLAVKVKLTAPGADSCCSETLFAAAFPLSLRGLTDALRCCFSLLPWGLSTAFRCCFSAVALGAFNCSALLLFSFVLRFATELCLTKTGKVSFQRRHLARQPAFYGPVMPPPGQGPQHIIRPCPPHTTHRAQIPSFCALFARPPLLLPQIPAVCALCR